MTDSDETVLVVRTQGATWRRRVGPLAWAALEYLALAARPDDQGWAAPLGVRTVATGIGVNKDTAARAITTLAAVGLVSRRQVTGCNGRSRSGYRLHLPKGLELQISPDNQDNPCRPKENGHCSENADTQMCPVKPDSGSSPGGARRPSLPRQPGGNRPQDTGLSLRSPASETQPSLFDHHVAQSYTTPADTQLANHDLTLNRHTLREKQ